MLQTPITFLEDDNFIVEKEVATHLIGFEECEFHNHNFIEFTYVLQGSCNHNYNGIVSNINACEAFLFMPNDSHNYVNEHSIDFLHRDIMFTFDYFKNVCKSYSDTLYDDLVSKKYPLRFTLEQSTISAIESIIPNILLNNTQTLSDIAAKTIAFYIINAILTKGITSPNADPDWLTKLLYFMNSSESKTLPLNIFLKTLPYSQGYLCHQFKKKMGCTMIEYFNKQKMKWAKTLILTTDLSIEKICEEIGFNNVSHFYTLFQKYYNTTPAKIRHNAKTE